MTTNSILPKIILVAGPTASGKSAIALELAEKSGGVIINADSQQLYRELPILTARPTSEEEGKAPHKLYGILSVAEGCSAGKWLQFARMEIDWARSQGRQPIVVGGTGLYLKALMQGIAEMPDIAPEVRAQAVSDYEEMGKEAFAARLREVDPQFFERLKVVDKQRLIRAWEVWLGSGRPLGWWQQQGATPLYAADEFELRKIELPREELYRRCNARFLKMIEQGAVEEVRAYTLSRRERVPSAARRVRASQVAPPSPGASRHPLPAGEGILNIIGVTEILAYLQGELTLPQAIEKAQQATRNYAKRQMTWIRNQF